MERHSIIIQRVVVIALLNEQVSLKKCTFNTRKLAQCKKDYVFLVSFIVGFMFITLRFRLNSEF